MKDYFKNPNLYYIAVPAIAAVWALMAGAVFYPGSVSAWQDDAKIEYEKSQEWTEKILTVQPQRLQYKGEGVTSGKFDFGDTISTFTQVFQIPTSKFTLNVREEVPKGGKRAQTATMKIKEIDIEKSARFLSAMLTGWPDLKCDVLGLEKAKTGKDNWNVDMTLTYYY